MLIDMKDFKNLIKRYDREPHNLYPEDLFPFVSALIEQTICISDTVATSIRISGEEFLPQRISGVYVLHPNTTKTNKVGIITIGVHGNEIWAGALCALEAFSAHEKGELDGTVIIQIGNMKAVQGYMASYNPKEYFLDRNGWRETNGIEREVQAVHCEDGSHVDILSDFNRIPRQVMHLPRDQHHNVDRAQELLWLYRAFLKGFTVDKNGALTSEKPAYDIKFVMHPHTSRMVGGIRNIALPPLTTQQFFDGQFDDMLKGLPESLSTMLEWEKGGLGGVQNLILDEHIELQHLAEKEFVETLPLIITFELGHHEDFCPDTIPSLSDLCGPATRTLLENSTCIKNTKAHKKTANIKTIFTEPYRLDLSYYDGFENLEGGDSVYLVTEKEKVMASPEYIAGHFPHSIVVDHNDQCTVVKTKDFSKNTEGRIFFCMPPFELSLLNQGQVVMIAFGDDKKAKFLTVPYDMYAVFTGDCRLEFPIMRWNPAIYKQKTFFRGVTKEMKS